MHAVINFNQKCREVKLRCTFIESYVTIELKFFHAKSNKDPIKGERQGLFLLYREIFLQQPFTAFFFQITNLNKLNYFLFSIFTKGKNSNFRKWYIFNFRIFIRITQFLNFLLFIFHSYILEAIKNTIFKKQKLVFI